jgi:cell wall-associated NlpC family hydrolase
MHEQVQQQEPLQGLSIHPTTGLGDLTGAAQREAVCAEALRWVGTPYHHHQRVHGVGVDCINLLCAVYHQVGVVGFVELEHYSQRWHLHRDEELFVQGLDKYLPRAQAPAAGDVVLFRFGRTYSHAGILLPGGEFVHAFARVKGRGQVMVSRLNEGWEARAPLYWSINKGV